MYSRSTLWILTNFLWWLQNRRWPSNQTISTKICYGRCSQTWINFYRQRLFYVSPHLFLLELQISYCMHISSLYIYKFPFLFAFPFCNFLLFDPTLFFQCFSFHDYWFLHLFFLSISILDKRNCLYHSILSAHNYSAQILKQLPDVFTRVIFLLHTTIHSVSVCVVVFFRFRIPSRCFSLESRIQNNTSVQSRLQIIPEHPFLIVDRRQYFTHKNQTLHLSAYV